MNSFANYHPFVLLIYYIAVLSMTMFMMHPVILFLSLLGSISFFLMLTSVRTLWREVRFYVFVFILITVTNPLFVHKGETILFFLNDNPFTLEAIVYGVFISMMLIAIIFWSKAYSIVMTSDKFVYLFGKTIPKLSLVISMALKFVPSFKHQIKKVQATQKTLGLYTSDSITDRIVSGIRTFNSMISWSLEHAIEQGDAMKAKGYGLKGRTNFSLFKWDKRDSMTLIIILLLFSGIMFVNAISGYQFSYYPTLSEWHIKESEIGKYFIIICLVFLPSLIEIKENLQWKYAKSKI